MYHCMTYCGKTIDKIKTKTLENMKQAIKALTERGFTMAEDEIQNFPPITFLETNQSKFSPPC